MRLDSIAPLLASFFLVGAIIAPIGCKKADRTKPQLEREDADRSPGIMAPARTPAAIAHSGVGSPPEMADGCRLAVDAALEVLKKTDDPVEAAVAGIAVLEDDPRYNAGTGSRVRIDGETVQMDASIMSANDQFGAVAIIEKVKNPIKVARDVIDTPHLLIAGDGATRFARAMGHAPYDPATPEMKAKTAEIQKRLRAADPSLPKKWKQLDWRRAWNFERTLEQAGLGPEETGSDTVGIVVRGKDGNIVAALSTGGTSITLRGRVGDVPVFGAGLFASPIAGVAATGVGEEIIKVGLARAIHDQLAQNTAIEAAAKSGVQLVQARGAIGLIVMTQTAMTAAADRPMAWAGRRLRLEEVVRAGPDEGVIVRLLPQLRFLRGPKQTVRSALVCSRGLGYVPAMRTGALIAASLFLVTACSSKNATDEPTAPPDPTTAPEKKPAAQEAKPPADGVIRIAEVGFATPESVLHDPQADLYLVSNINGSPLAADDNGFISRLKPDGTVAELKWIDGAREEVQLNAPKGMTIAGDKLYVTDITAVRIFDRKTGLPRGAITIAGTTFLNDLTAGAFGVYVSDSGMKTGPNGFEPSGSDAIYRIDSSGKTTAVIAQPDLDGPNGLLAGEDGLWVVTFRSNKMFHLGFEGARSRQSELTTGGLDGVVALANGDLLISSWEGKSILRGKPDAQLTPVITGVESPADIGYDAKRNRLLLPLFTKDIVEIHPVAP